jgi:hypothetical protein
VLLGGSTGMAVAGAAIWLALTLAGLARAAGADLPDLATIFCGAVAAPIALAAAAHSIACIWRGPTILPFRRDESVICTPDEAAYVRLASQLRGTMGGAGFLYPRRLILPAVAWILAAAEGAVVVTRAAGGLTWLVVAAVGTAAASFLLPARPYYYRETTGGGAILSPPSVAYRLMRRATIANAIARGEPVDSTTPAPTPLPTPALTPGPATQRDGAS